MEGLISDLVHGYEQGSLSRRQLVRGLAMLAGGAVVGAKAALAAPQGGMSKSAGGLKGTALVNRARQLGPSNLHPETVNHVAITVGNLQESKLWYRNLFNLQDWHDEAHGTYLGFGDSMLVLRPAMRAGQASGKISHFMFGVPEFNADAMEAELKKYGLAPRKDQDSFHVTDPDGLNVQIGAKALGWPTSTR